MSMEKNKTILLPCPVCGTPMFEEVEDFEICDVCGWENDGTAEWRPEVCSANDVCFKDAKKMWENGETVFEGWPNPNAKE